MAATIPGRGRPVEGADVKHCAVDGCKAPKRARGWCNAHYIRWYKHGDPEHRVERHEVCTVVDCGKPTPGPRIDGLCEKHRTRVRRHGDPQVVKPRRLPTASYNQAHYWVRRDNGSARMRDCVDCGQAAEQWSYTHQDPDELVSEEGFPYSLDAAYYEPRCRPCHAVFDRLRVGAG